MLDKGFGFLTQGWTAEVAFFRTTLCANRRSRAKMQGFPRETQPDIEGRAPQTGIYIFYDPHLEKLFVSQAIARVLDGP